MGRVTKELSKLKNLNLIALPDYPQNIALGWEKIIHGLYLIPEAITSPEIITNRIIEINSVNKLDCVIPCDDEDIYAISKGKHILADNGIHTLIPPPFAIEAVQKSNLYKTLVGMGLHVPPQLCIKDR